MSERRYLLPDAARLYASLCQRRDCVDPVSGSESL